MRPTRLSIARSFFFHAFKRIISLHVRRIAMAGSFIPVAGSVGPFIEERNPVRSYSQNQNDGCPLWIFGYGSLIWKTNFPYRQKLVGKINGYSRKFWQGSTDHRGVPGKPGRVATLVEDKTAETWGVAFEVMHGHVEEVMRYLDYREKGGYSLHRIQFYPEDTKMVPFQVTLYVATPDNEEFLGDAPLPEIALQIAQSIGPSGKNSDYLYCLAHALRELRLERHDQHIFELERLLRDLETNNATK